MWSARAGIHGSCAWSAIFVVPAPPSGCGTCSWPLSLTPAASPRRPRRPRGFVDASPAGREHCGKQASGRRQAAAVDTGHRQAPFSVRPILPRPCHQCLAPHRAWMASVVALPGGSSVWSTTVTIRASASLTSRARQNCASACGSCRSPPRRPQKALRCGCRAPLSRSKHSPGHTRSGAGAVELKMISSGPSRHCGVREWGVFARAICPDSHEYASLVGDQKDLPDHIQMRH